MKKIILFGLLGGLIVLILGTLCSQLFHFIFPSLKSEFENTALFRPWTDPLMSLYFLHPFLLGIILAWVWNKVKPVIVVDDNLLKGVYFGLSAWVVLTLPGMLISYASFPISFLMIFSWTFNSLVELLCLGILFSKTLK